MRTRGCIHVLSDLDFAVTAVAAEEVPDVVVDVEGEQHSAGPHWPSVAAEVVDLTWFLYVILQTKDSK